MAKPKQKAKVLYCKCGDCLHWEVVKQGRRTYLKCKTCSEIFDTQIKVNPSYVKLAWLERDEV